MQNTIVNLGPNYQMNFIVRDLGGSRIDLNTLTHKLKISTCPIKVYWQIQLKKLLRNFSMLLFRIS